MSQDYIHGYSIMEQRRLIRQAEVLAPTVHAGLDLAGVRRLLELGCGAGAELGFLASHQAGLELTGIERNAGHLAAAREHLASLDRQHAPQLLQADATALPFAAHSFDAVMTVWMLEHVARPAAVLGEALRVLVPDGRLICTEVDNATLKFEPEQPAIRDWVDRFNRFQEQAGGDPFVGRRLSETARSLRARDIRSETLPILSSRFEPDRRPALIDYLEELLLSGAEPMLAAGRAGHREIDSLRTAFDGVRQDPGVEFRYFAVRMCCRPPH